MKIKIQLFGGGGSGSILPKGGGGGKPPLSAESLISAREDGKMREVDEVLTVARDVADQYPGVSARDFEIGTFPPGSPVMAYYDSSDAVGVNEAFFDDAKITSAYDKAVQSGFHPGRGSKSAMEASAAHEMGHLLTARAADRAGDADFQTQTAPRIVKEARKRIGVKNTMSMANAISGYAKTNYAECIAEAFSDVYCNGSNATRESRAIVDVLNEYFH